MSDSLDPDQARKYRVRFEFTLYTGNQQTKIYATGRVNVHALCLKVSVSEYEQGIPQIHTADQPMALRGRATNIYRNNTSERQ